jgi:hypothetical protein
MQLVDRIEKRRFVGREFLLWLWFESEIFEGTLETNQHGPFGLWVEKQLVLSVGKEGTRIKGAQPASSREAKESILLGKLPETAGLHLTLNDRESTFVLKAEQLSLGGVVLATVLGGADDEPPQLLDEPGPTRRKRAAPRSSDPSDEEHEAFYERMRLTGELESVVQALYRDFLALRLGPTWEATVAPALRLWAAGEEVDADDYRAARDRSLSPGARRKSG